jgi:EAL domain-containing protein (putative c-di-GMP-specific phosphodiesterase class I)
LSVVAEGVETSEQAQLLHARHCALAQGFFYSKPVDSARFETLLAQQHGTA